jgi:hypothetical protein
MLILATPAVFLLSPGRANAILTYTIDQSDGDVIIQEWCPKSTYVSACRSKLRFWSIHISSRLSGVHWLV